MHNISFQKKGSLGVYTSFKLLKELSVFFAFTTRFGGISPSPYDSLNLAFHVGDNPTNVVKNREILCSTFGLNLSLVTAPEQIHSDGVKIVDSSLKGRGAYSANTAIDRADALITDLKRVPLVIFLADCVPVVLVERHAKAVGIVHAGWQGTYKEIALKTAKLMKETYNLSYEDVFVFIGPSIGPCCYEVSLDLSANFKRKFSFAKNAFNDNFLNLQFLNKLQLINEGILEENIAVVDSCTCCEKEMFFSYRREKITGRQCALVAIL